MNTEDKIKDLFAEKLGQLESPVNPNVWNGIASQVGTTSATSVGGAGVSLLSKVFIGIGAACVVGLGVFFSIKDSNAEPTAPNHGELQPQIEQPTASKDFVETNADYSKGLSADSNHKVQVFDKQLNEAPIANQEKIETEQQVTIITPVNPSQSDVNESIHTPAKKEKMNEGQATEAPVLGKSNESVKPTIQTAEVQISESNADQRAEHNATFELTKVPNVYVLNANGYFSISYTGEYQDFQFTLMDSRNKVVFSSNHPNFEWRGLDLSGNLVEPGNYIYIITATDKNGKGVNTYSPLTIIRQ